ncbi:NAD(P)H-dependent flavin oxidoreductase [Halomonas mongoliensis]|uniref:NAD(P)H-dependent flavin oxidoreductase n=1 Tax=Halomonas mongoliensis TaxID=321265 RepID=UPI00403ACD04
MPIPSLFDGRLTLPVVASPMFIVSGPELVISQCKAGIVGSFPSLNARPADELPRWLTRIEGELAAARREDPEARIAPYAVNLIVHPSNPRLEQDLAVCVEHRVPLVITSLSPPETVVPAVHSYGGLVFHDVINVRHARKAVAAGVDGLILVCAGAGGHGGTLNPMALVAEIRRFYEGPLLLSGAISRGDQILAAQAMGADMAYIGTRFIASSEANAVSDYKAMVTDSTIADIVYTDLFTGVNGNYLRGSIEAAGLDPDDLPDRGGRQVSVREEGAKQSAWRDIWGAGQGVGSIDAVLPVAEIVDGLIREYHQALGRVERQSAVFLKETVV